MCVCVRTCLMQIDGELSPAERRVVSMHCLRSPAHCLHSNLPSTDVVCVCVFDACWMCVSMSLLWSEMTLRNTAILPNSQYHPISPHWNQHGGVVIGWNVLLLQSFSVATFFGTDFFPIRDVLDDGWWWRFTARKAKPGGGGWALFRCFGVGVYVRVCAC